MNRRDFVALLATGVGGALASPIIASASDSQELELKEAENLGPLVEDLARKVNSRNAYMAVDLGYLQKQYPRSDGTVDEQKIYDTLEERLVREYRLCPAGAERSSVRLRLWMQYVKGVYNGKESSAVLECENLLGQPVRFLIIEPDHTKKGEFLVNTGFFPKTIERLGIDTRFYLCYPEARTLLAWHEFGHFIRPPRNEKVSAMRSCHNEEGYADTFMALMTPDRGRATEILTAISRFRCANGFNAAIYGIEYDEKGLFCPSIVYMTHAMLDAAIRDPLRKTVPASVDDIIRNAARAEKIAAKQSYGQNELKTTAEEILLGHARLMHALGGLPGRDVSKPSRELFYGLEAADRARTPDYARNTKYIGEELFLQEMLDRKFVDPDMEWVAPVQEANRFVLTQTRIARREPAGEIDIQTDTRRGFLKRVLAPVQDVTGPFRG